MPVQSFLVGSAEAVDDTEWQPYFALCAVLLPSLSAQRLVLRTFLKKLCMLTCFRVCFLGKLETGADASSCLEEPDLPLSLPAGMISVYSHQHTLHTYASKSQVGVTAWRKCSWSLANSAVSFSAAIVKLDKGLNG